MRKVHYIYIFFSILIFGFISTVYSQKADTNVERYRIELKDGTTLLGEIISEDENTIYFKTLSNIEVSILKDKIRRKEIISGKMVEGKFLRQDPNNTRLFYAPTGRGLKAGQAYFSIYEIFFPTVAVGITDFFALAGGISLFPGADEQLLYIAPKITPVQTNTFDLSAGVLILKIPDEEETAGIAYGVSTYGTQKAALTLGIGFAFAGGDFADKPVFAVGGEIRASNSVKFISENWFIPDSEVQLVSGGIRFFGENIAADFALLYPAGSDIEGWPFIPWIGFAYNFGRR